MARRILESERLPRTSRGEGQRLEAEDRTAEGTARQGTTEMPNRTTVTAVRKPPARAGPSRC